VPGSPRILLVARDPRFRLLLSDFLAIHQFSVDPFGSFEESASSLSSQYSLILFDSFDPAQDGAAFVESIRSARPVVPIVLLTAQKPLPESSSALYGADQIFLKPFDLEEFVAAIFALIRRKSKEQKPP
jgi:DNA-binding response OmpR family regulator